MSSGDIYYLSNHQGAVKLKQMEDYGLILRLDEIHFAPVNTTKPWFQPWFQAGAKGLRNHPQYAIPTLAWQREAFPLPVQRGKRGLPDKQSHQLGLS